MKLATHVKKKYFCHCRFIVDDCYGEQSVNLSAKMLIIFRIYEKYKSFYTTLVGRSP